jgi:dihydrofolate reductase
MPKQSELLTLTFVTESGGSAIAQATAAAGDKAVQVVGGASVAQELLSAGLVDELRVDVMPVLLGSGLRFFKDEGIQRVQLEKIGVHGIGPRTSLRFRVHK